MGRRKLYTDKVTVTVDFERDEISLIKSVAGDRNFGPWIRTLAMKAVKKALKDA